MLERPSQASPGGAMPSICIPLRFVIPFTYVKIGYLDGGFVCGLGATDERLPAREDNALYDFGELRPAYGVWDWDLGSNIIYADEAAARIFGVDAQLAKKGLPPETYFALIHEDDRQMIIDHSLLSISTIGSCADNFRLVGDFGTKWVHSQGRCFADSDNKPKCFIGLVAEIGQIFETDRKTGGATTAAGDDILYLSLYARRIAEQTKRPFVAYLLDMVIAEVTDFKDSSRC